MKNIRILSGIDALHFFYQSNKTYDNFFLKLLSDLEKEKEKFTLKEVKYQTNDINIFILSTPFSYLGNSEGYYWFRDLDEYFKLGFKDSNKNKVLHDIRVQLQAKSFYTIGLSSILSYIQDLLYSITTNYTQVSRIDLNVFVDQDLSFLDISMFATRKRDSLAINKTFKKSNKLQTLYIGKKPFLLRIYDKKEELKNSIKYHIMHEYFSMYGFSFNEPLWNIEFECHRQFLRQFNLNSVDEVITNASSLFSACLNAIRLVVNPTKNNKYKCQTHPLWEELKKHYSIDSFMQSLIPLQRVKRRQEYFGYDKLEEEMTKLIKKAIIAKLSIDEKDFKKYKDLAKRSFYGHRANSTPLTPLIIYDKNKNISQYTFFNPMDTLKRDDIKPHELSHKELLIYLAYLSRELTNKNTTIKNLNFYYEYAYKEAVKRGLEEYLEF